jgi:hypothetical protein
VFRADVAPQILDRTLDKKEAVQAEGDGKRYVIDS